MPIDPVILPAPQSEAELEDLLSRPTPELVSAVGKNPGDWIILGAGGKMGPSLARMARRALDEAGSTGRVTAVARFSDSAARGQLENAGIETVRCDLLDREAVGRLPDAENVVFMAGQKFGTSGAPEQTWAVNTLTPAFAAERYARSRVVAFSTGCVYADAPISGSGSREGDPLEPLGEYANSCVARERIFQYYSGRNGTAMALVRLNYANDLRYGVLVDIARAVWEGQPVDVSTGYANVIWQGDANAFALRLVEHAASPPLAVNVTGFEKISIREVADRFGGLFGKSVSISGTEGPKALLSDSGLSRQLLGETAVSLEQMIRWTADWIRGGGHLLNKPTHFQTRDGRF